MPVQLSEGREFDSQGIVGHLFAIHIGEDGDITPWCIKIEGGQYLPVFPTLDALVAAMKWIGIDEYVATPIYDAHYFLDTCAQTGFKAVLNLRQEEGRVRWTELRYPWKPNEDE